MMLVRRLFRCCVPSPSGGELEKLAAVLRAIRWRVPIGADPSRQVVVCEPEDGGWYDARSQRVVKRVPQGDAVALNGLRIAFSPESLEAFLTLNQDNLREWFSAQRLIHGSQPEPMINDLPLGQHITPSQHVPTLCAEFVRQCEARRATNAHGAFDWCGVFARARVERVIDGDTLDVSAEIPSDYMREVARDARSRMSLLRALHRATAPPTLSVHLRLRLYGVNAAEHSTPEGREATEHTRRFLMRGARWGAAPSSAEEAFRPIWVYFGGRDKYGRTLAVVYLDARRRSLLNSYLVDLSTPDGVVYAVPYLAN